MATEITNTRELNIQLLSEDGNASRIIKLSNPRTDVTLAQVTTAINKSFIVGERGDDNFYFFYDDGNQGGYSVPMVKLGYAEVVEISKSVNRLGA